MASKHATLAAVVAAFLLASLSGCAAPSPDADENASAAQSAAPAAEVKVEIVRFDVSKPATDMSAGGSKRTCTATGSYAKVSGLADAGVQKKLNEVLYPEELRSVASCEQPFDADTTTSVLFEAPSILSIRRTTSERQAGAEANRNVVGQTFDLRTGNELGFEQLLGDASGKKLAKVVVDALRRGTATEKKTAEIAGDQILEDPTMMSLGLTKEGLTVIVAGYLPPDAAGKAEDALEIPYAELDGVLSATSPAASVWTTPKR